MNTKLFTRIFLGLMALAFCKVGLEALINPQAVLSQVGIILDNPSALSSMRAVYGGMHLSFGLFCFWGMIRGAQGPLGLIMLYTAGFVTGRLSGILLNGMPNSFVLTWLITESISFLIAFVLWKLQTKSLMEFSGVTNSMAK